MIGLDTNVLIRYITQDDDNQAAQAAKLIENELTEREPGFITLITLVEITWVLESCYQQNKHSILNVLHKLLTTTQLLIERADLAYLALKRCHTSPQTSDFSDALISVICEAAGCERVITFDKKAVNIGMQPLD